MWLTGLGWLPSGEKWYWVYGDGGAMLKGGSSKKGKQ